MTTLRRANLGLTGLGALVFGALLALLLLAPGWLDRTAGAWAVAEVSDRLEAALPDLAARPDDGAAISAQLRDRLPGALRDRMAGLGALARPEIEDLVQRIVAEGCGCLDRPSGGRIDAGDVAAFFADVRADLAASQDRIRAFALGQFDAVLAEVRRDVTIFVATSLALVLAAFLLGVVKGRASAHLFPISLILAGTTVIMGSWYLLGQDWLLTVIFSDYWGLAYPAFAAVLAGLLADVAFLKGHVTTSLLSVPITPC